MPVSRGKKRKSTNTKNEGATSKKPSLLEITNTKSCFPELLQEDQNFKEKYFNQPNVTDSCILQSIDASQTVDNVAESGTNSGEVQDRESPNARNSSIGDTNKSKLEFSTYDTGSVSDKDSAKADLLKDSDKENPIIHNEIKAVSLEKYCENIEALANFNNPCEMEQFRDTFLSASQPVISSRNSSSFCEKLSKRFKPPSSKFDIDLIAKEPYPLCKEKESVMGLTDKHKSRGDLDCLALGDTDKGANNSNILEKQLNPEVDLCKSSNPVKTDESELDERCEEKDKIKSDLDSDAISGVGKNIKEASINCSANLVLDSKSQGSESHLHFEKEIMVGTYAKAESCRDKSSWIAVQHSNLSLQEKHNFKEAGRSSEDNQNDCHNSVLENECFSETTFESGMKTQGFNEHASNGSEKKLRSSDEAPKIHSSSMTLSSAERAATQKIALKILGSPKCTNQLENVDQISFSPFEVVPDENCQKQRSPTSKTVKQLEGTEKIEITKRMEPDMQDCKEGSGKTINSESQEPVKSADSCKSGLPDTDGFQVSNQDLGNQKEDKNSQHLNNSETNFSFSPSSLNKTLSFKQNSEEKEIHWNSCNLKGNDLMEDKKGATKTIISALKFTDMIQGKAENNENAKGDGQEHTTDWSKTLKTSMVSSDAGISKLNGKTLDSLSTLQATTKISVGKEENTLKVDHKHKMSPNCNDFAKSIDGFNNFSFSNCLFSSPPQQNNISKIDSSGVTEHESKNVAINKVLCEKKDVKRGELNSLMLKNATLNVTDDLNITNQASENASDDILVHEILDILSEPQTQNIRSENHNTQSKENDISFTTKTQSYSFSEPGSHSDEQNQTELDLEQSLADALDDIQSTGTAMSFCDLDPQTFLFDNNDKNIEEMNQEDINGLEYNFNKNQKLAAEDVSMKRVEGASIVKAIMGDLMFTNRQVMKMKKEMDLLSRSLDRISKQRGNADKGVSSIGAW